METPNRNFQLASTPPRSPNRYGARYNPDNIINAVDEDEIDEELQRTHEQTDSAKKRAREKQRNILQRFHIAHLKEKQQAELKEKEELQRSVDRYLAMQKLQKEVRSPKSTSKRRDAFSPSARSPNPRLVFGSPTSTPMSSPTRADPKTPVKSNKRITTDRCRSSLKYKTFETPEKWAKAQEYRAKKRANSLRKRTIQAIADLDHVTAKSGIDIMDLDMLNSQPERDFGKTLLHYCVLSGNLPMAKFLTEKRVDPNLQSWDEMGGTPMHFVMEFILDAQERIKWIALLIQANGRADVPREQDGRTVFHMAVVNEDELVLEYIVAYHPVNLDLNVVDRHGRTAVLDAMNLPSAKIMQRVINHSRWTVKPLLALPAQQTQSVDPNAADRIIALEYPIHTLIEEEQPLVVVQEVIDRIDKSRLAEKRQSDGRTPIMIINGHLDLHVEVLEILLNHQSTVEAINETDYSGCTALYLATAMGSVRMVELLLRHGADPNIGVPLTEDTQHTVATALYPLHVAVDGTVYRTPEECVEMINLLLGNEDNVEDENSWRLSAHINLLDQSWGGMTALHLAINHGNHRAMECLLARPNCYVNLQTEDTKQTPLHLAIDKDDIEAIKILLRRDTIDCNEKDKDGYTPAWAAMMRNREEIVELLVRSTTAENLDINMSDSNTGSTLLTSAIENDMFALLRALLDRPDLNIHIPNDTNRTILHFACNQGKIDALDVLLTYKCPHTAELRSLISQSDKLGVTPMSMAALRGDIRTCQLLMKHTETPPGTNYDWTLLYSAAWNGQSQLVKRLVQENPELCKSFDDEDRMLHANPDTTWTPLHVATFRGHLEAVKIILDAGASPNPLSTPQQPPPFFLACHAGQAAVVKYLITLDNDTNKDSILNCNWYRENASPLHAAISQGHFHVAKILIAQGLFINYASPLFGNYTPLHMLVSTAATPSVEHFETLQLLLSNQSVNVNAQDADGWTPFYRACTLANLVAIYAMLQHPDVQVTNDSSLFHNTAVSAVIARDSHVALKWMLQTEQERQKQSSSSSSSSSGDRQHSVLEDKAYVEKMMQYCESVAAENCAEVISFHFREKMGIVKSSDSTVWSGARLTPLGVDRHATVFRTPNPPNIFIGRQHIDKVPQDESEAVRNRNTVDLDSLKEHMEEKERVEVRKHIGTMVTGVLQVIIDRENELQRQREALRHVIREVMAPIVQRTIDHACAAHEVTKSIVTNIFSKVLEAAGKYVDAQNVPSEETSLHPGPASIRPDGVLPEKAKEAIESFVAESMEHIVDEHVVA